MKRSQVNKILDEQVKRKNKLISYVCVIVVLALLALSSLLLYVRNNRPLYVKYLEKSKLDYNVYLKENTFFEDSYLSANKQYIASLIDYIDANFNYQLNIDKSDIDYQYSYKIVAKVLVKNKSNQNILYEYSEDILKEITKNTYNGSDTYINEKVIIDYNKYNSLIKRFVNTYKLEDVTSELNVKMYITTLGDCDDIENNNKNSVISLVIPLTQETIAIDMNYELVDPSEEKLMICNDVPNYNFIFIIFAILNIVCILVLIYKMFKYIIATRTAESIYQREFKKILYNYKSYIQKVTKSIDLTGYQKIDIDTFTDLLEIRDTIRQPILMANNESVQSVYFVIPTNNKIVYVYALRANDIRRKLEEKNEKE